MLSAVQPAAPVGPDVVVQLDRHRRGHAQHVELDRGPMAVVLWPRIGAGLDPRGEDEWVDPGQAPPDDGTDRTRAGDIVHARGAARRRSRGADTDHHQHDRGEYRHGPGEERDPHAYSAVASRAAERANTWAIPRAAS